MLNSVVKILLTRPWPHTNECPLANAMTRYNQFKLDVCVFDTCHHSARHVICDCTHAWLGVDHTRRLTWCTDLIDRLLMWLHYNVTVVRRLNCVLRCRLHQVLMCVLLTYSSVTQICFQHLFHRTVDTRTHTCILRFNDALFRQTFVS